MRIESTGTCSWCGEPILDTGDVALGPGVHIGEQVPMHSECAEEAEAE